MCVLFDKCVFHFPISGTFQIRENYKQIRSHCSTRWICRETEHTWMRCDPWHHRPPSQHAGHALSCLLMSAVIKAKGLASVRWLMRGPVSVIETGDVGNKGEVELRNQRLLIKSAETLLIVARPLNTHAITPSHMQSIKNTSTRISHLLSMTTGQIIISNSNCCCCCLDLYSGLY